jgi:hypothetical protein
MTDIEKIDYATTAFQCLVNEQQNRLRRGLILRQKMHNAIERGEDPDDYRARWMKETTGKLARFLAEEAERFNKQHVNDMASVADLLDILATATHHFQNEE